MKQPSTGQVIHEPLAHESARLHVSGAARYIDDLPQPAGLLHGAVGFSGQAHAVICAMDLDEVRNAPGVVAVFTAADLPAKNNHGPILHDDPLLAEGRVEYVGQSLFFVVATSTNLARAAARLAQVEYEPVAPILEIGQAVAADQHVVPEQTLLCGDPDHALAAAPHRLKGRLTMGGQDHFYLEGQIAVAVPGESGAMEVFSSTQHPTEVQHLVAEALGLKSAEVVVQCRRMGGGFGGKETQPALFACLAAVAARALSKPVKVRVDRDSDMHITGKRHPYEASWDVGFNSDGRIEGIKFVFDSDCGRSADLSGPVNARTIFHADNCYFLRHASLRSRRLKTNKASNTAFRGFGGPQGMLGVETVINDIANYLQLDPLTVRRVNLYGTRDRNVTPYGMLVEDNIAPRLIDELVASSNYVARRDAIAALNAKGRSLRRGIALTPVKFGISFTARHYNQAGALLHVYRDGSVRLNHGGTEMGQGLYTKVAQVVAQALGVVYSTVTCSAADTSKVPNTSATAASAGSDLNGMAALDAATKIRRRLTAWAAEEFQINERHIQFADGIVTIGEQSMRFADLANRAYLARIPLSATGFYKTPKIDYDPDTLKGRPFYYFSYGAAVSEVAVDTLTGESKLLRVDILHDVGKSLNPALDLGQIEGGFLQGVGWLTSEELCWDENGRLTTHAPSTYKIPTVSDWPEQFNVQIASWSENSEATIYRSKAVGEPPLMLSISVFQAIREAIASLAHGKQPVTLDAPATPEAVLLAVQALREQD